MINKTILRVHRADVSDLLKMNQDDAPCIFIAQKQGNVRHKTRHFSAIRRKNQPYQRKNKTGTSSAEDIASTSTMMRKTI